MENKINKADIKVGDRVLVSGWSWDNRDDKAWGTVLKNDLYEENVRVNMDNPTLDGGHRYEWQGEENACYLAYHTEVHDHKPKLPVVPDLPKPTESTQDALADIQNTLDYLKKVTGVEHKPMTQEIELGIPNGGGSAGYIQIKFVREEV